MSLFLIDKSQLQLQIAAMTDVLDGRDLERVQQCYGGHHSFATNWIINWSLQHVVCAGLTQDYGRNRTIFIPSNSVTSDVERFGRCESPREFALGAEYLKDCSLHSLQTALGEQTLEESKKIDYLLLPLNTKDQHWSLLVVDVPRRLVVHMDSYRDPSSGHARLALAATNMMIAGGLLRPFSMQFRESKLPVQPDGQLCGYCLLRCAAAYSAGGLENAEAVQFDLQRLRETMLCIMSAAKAHESHKEFERRLNNYFELAPLEQ